METQRPNCLTPSKQKAAIGDDLPPKKPKFDVSSEDDVKSAPAEESPADLTADDISTDGEGDEPAEEERVTELLGIISDSSDTDMLDPKYDKYYDTPEAIAERDNFNAYREEYRRTKGFDMTVRYNRGGVEPLPLDSKDDPDGLIKACWTGVQDVIDFKNKQNNKKLKLLKISKCNYGFPWFFYATFDAVDENTGDEFTYQAKFIHNILDGSTEIHRFRLKPESDA